MNTNNDHLFFQNNALCFVFLWIMIHMIRQNGIVWTTAWTRLRRQGKQKIAYIHSSPQTPIFRAVTWISSSTLPSRSELSLLKCFLDLCKQGSVMTSQTQIGNMDRIKFAISLFNTHLRFFFFTCLRCSMEKKAQSDALSWCQRVFHLGWVNIREPTRLESQFFCLMVSKIIYRHPTSLSYSWIIQSQHHVHHQVPRAWTAKLSCFPQNSDPRLWEETKQYSLQRRLCRRGH